MEFASYRHIVHAKVMPPAPTPGLVVRERVLALMSPTPRFTLLSAMPGYGKTVLVRQWIDTLDVPVAWVSLDVLDRDPTTFWAHVIHALTTACPQIDDEPAQLLLERGPDDPLFLSALIAQLAATQDHLVLVLDGLHTQLSPTVLDGTALLVDRLGETVHVVATTRVDPPLPLARWRSLGWMVDLREIDLRLTDDESTALGASVDTAVTSPRELVALNRRVEGWPIAFHMALLARPSSLTAFEAGDDLLAGADRLLANYLVTELLDAMSDAERDVALSLSVLRWFDSDLCVALVGDDAVPVVERLIGRGMFLSVVETRSGVMRFHELFRELLERELGWRHPVRRVELHRSAALLWRERGDLMSAFHHLTEIGEAGTAQQLLISPALEFVDRGELEQLRGFAQLLPTPAEVDDPNLALELAGVALYANGTRAGQHWAERASVLIGGRPDGAASENWATRLDGVRCAIALSQADLIAAAGRVEARRRGAISVPSVSHLEDRFPIIAARVMLAARRQPEADEWIARAAHIDGPEILTEVTIPTLQAWFEWLFGRLDAAVSLLDGALRFMSEHHIGAHHYAFDTLISGGWCQLSIGNLGEATRLAERAGIDAEVLGTAWNHLQADYLSARIAMVAGDPHQALRIIDNLRETIALDSCRPYSDRLLAIEVEALAVTGRARDAERVLVTLHPSPRTQLLRSRFGRLPMQEADDLLAERGGWPMQERLEAELLLAARQPRGKPTEALIAVVAECGQSGWVLPLLGHGPRVDRLLEALPLHTIHPQLDRALANLTPRGPLRHDETVGVRLTSREQALLELLPTHLSYSGIGERLFLSINTVKFNLKVLYRKLDATSRAEAIEAGERTGLL